MTTYKAKDLDLQKLGLNDNLVISRNLSYQDLVLDIVNNGEGHIASSGAAMIDSGKYTGRSPKDKYIVDETSSNDKIWWGEVNQKISEKIFDQLYSKVIEYYNNSKTKTYIFDGFAGAEKAYNLSVRFLVKKAWQAHFVNNMFIRPEIDQLNNFSADFTIINASDVKNINYKAYGMNSEAFIIFHLEKKIAIIGGTEYGGEMKKGIFSVLHYILPQKGVLSMHCSANVDNNGKNAALFFGLSGTGKTTLSTDSQRPLIGDDEHGWGSNGVFNFEGGCYAKLINLSEEDEPEIFGTTRKKGTVLENIGVDQNNVPDFFDTSKTENTRGSYPIEFIENRTEDSKGGHPQNVIFLTCDAFGVLPPISRLTPSQATYHFISGYTAKVAGTEVGVTEPQATFSACFGEPFMPMHPGVYADLLSSKMDEHGSTAWLINTGWSGGPYGVGNRMKIKYTRAMLNAALDGELDNVDYIKDDRFGFEIPTSCPGVPSEVLIPKQTWDSGEDYDATADKLAGMFNENFKRYSAGVSDEVNSAAPQTA